MIFLDIDDFFFAVGEYVKDHLSSLGNYPLVKGKIAFYDEETNYKYLMRGRWRDPTHIVERSTWDFRTRRGGGMTYFGIYNKKMVGHWNLVEDILSVGTTRYNSKRRMSFFDRYKNKWKFAQTRAGISSEFVGAFNLLITEALENALAKAAKDWRSGRI